jgi:hypothetical protein
VSTPADEPAQPSTPAEQADPAPRPSRRVFSPEYKMGIVTEYENAPNGAKGAILRLANNRLIHDPTTREFAAKRRLQGNNRNEILRILKR